MDDDSSRVVEVPMRFRTWPVAAVALGLLLLLVVVAVLESSRRAQEIYSRLDGLNERYHNVEAKLRRLRSDVNLSGIFVRDYLLDPAPERAPEYRQRIAQFRQRTVGDFKELQELTRGREEVIQRIVGLGAKLDDYWQALDPIFDWSATDKTQSSASFLRREVLPRREAVMAITSEIEELNKATMSAQRIEVTQQQTQLRRDLYKLLWSSLVLGLVVAVTAVSRLRRLERRSESERAHAANAERQMRQLSQQLVAAQEEERTKLSRELHDHVGQMLTALRMELGTIDRLRAPSDEPIARSVAEGRQLVDTMVRTVRDLALGLRPSMLDDLGLQPALEWQAREFTRRYELPAHLNVHGDLSELPDPHRTCVYRVIQEALTNCARHANATTVRVTVERHGDALEVKVVDDGSGFDVARRGAGFGLHGIEERVKELGGEMTVRSVKGGGTSLRIVLPLNPVATTREVTLARAAG
jgi:signal transduction histidine kinase